VGVPSLRHWQRLSPLWLIPGGVLLLGGAAVLAVLRSAAEESKLLLDELVRQREVGRSLRRLDESLRAVGGTLRSLR